MYRCRADAVGPMIRPRVCVRISHKGLSSHANFKKTHSRELAEDYCLVALRIASCTTEEGARVACKECGAFGMLNDMGRARATPGTRGRPW